MIIIENIDGDFWESNDTNDNGCHLCPERWILRKVKLLAEKVEGR